MRRSASSSSAAETPQQHIVVCSRMARSRERIDLKLPGFYYNKYDDYRNHKDVLIGAMNKHYLHCSILKFPKESPGMCCSNGKVILPPVMEPSELLLSYISGANPISKHFLQIIQKYNTCIQMMSASCPPLKFKAKCTTDLDHCSRFPMTIRKIPIDPSTNEISFPDFCQMQMNIQDVVDKVFPSLTTNYNNSDCLWEHAILAPTNYDVNKINKQIQLKLPGKTIKYK